MSNLQNYIGRIDRVLAQMDSYSQQRLFDLYTSLLEEEKESFVLALIARLIVAEEMRRLKI